MHNQFGELTKSLVQSLTRRAALKTSGAGLAALLGVLVFPSGSATAEPNHKRFATVMTYNIYQGTELEHVLAATDLSSFVAGVTIDYANVIATSFPERARAIAAEIAQNQPDLVGLQEVALWRTRVPANPSLPATDVAYDFLDILLNALNAAGQHYRSVIVRNNFDTQGTGVLPTGEFYDVRLTDRTAILARTDLLDADLQISNPQQQDFSVNAEFDLLGKHIVVLGGWASVDAKIRGKSFRFITTHLDPLSSAVRTAQVYEMLQGLTLSPIPAIVAGDFNAIPGEPPYLAMLGAGFVDTWAATHPADQGYTCCQVPPDSIVNPVSALSTRVDYVFAGGGFDIIDEHIIGNTPAERTPSGLWPTDHAGIVATLQYPGK
jgi:endonuclease/exonuclease/phosphatase family metal-dependent hydrolase